MPNWGLNAQLGISNWRLGIRDWRLGIGIKAGIGLKRLEMAEIGWNGLE